jgi:peptidoglycan/xylan/chitin deacetylase (PgdA/CDA1 family)
MSGESKASGRAVSSQPLEGRRSMMRALMYHDVVATDEADASGFPGADAALYKVTPEQFEAHLAAIARRVSGAAAPYDHPGRPAIPGTAKAAPYDNRKAANPAPPAPPAPPALSALAVTFDDGGRSSVAAADVLERYGFVGHFFVTVNYIGTRGFVRDADIRSLRQRGHVIGSHSCSHPLRMGHCSWRQLVDEWTRSCGTLGDIMGEPVEVASVPGGDFAPAVAEAAAAAGITQLFTSEATASTQRISGVLLRGRYTIQRWTTAETAAALAAGDWLPTARQAMVWNAKKITKRIGGERYLQLRRLLLGHRSEVRWGDQR